MTKKSDILHQKGLRKLRNPFIFFYLIKNQYKSNNFCILQFCDIFAIFVIFLIFLLPKYNIIATIMLPTKKM